MSLTLTISSLTVSTANTVNPNTNASSYILRELVEIPDLVPVNWWPQTLGWKIIGLVLVILGFYASYKAARHWWHNRYRREALYALQHINLTTTHDALTEMSSIIKVTLNYAFMSNTASLFGRDLLQFLDRTAPINLNNDVGLRWQQALLLPSDGCSFSHSDILLIQQQLCLWVKKHKVNIKGNNKEDNSEFNYAANTSQTLQPSTKREA